MRVLPQQSVAGFCSVDLGTLRYLPFLPASTVALRSHGSRGRLSPVGKDPKVRVEYHLPPFGWAQARSFSGQEIWGAGRHYVMILKCANWFELTSLWSAGAILILLIL